MAETYYDQIAEGYDRLHGEEQMHKIALAKELISPKKGDKLLDVGCGSGISTRAWESVRSGIDPSSKLIEIAKKNDNSYADNYFVKGAEEIPFEDKMFDYVISFTAIQNFTDLDKGLSEIKRVTKKEGQILITTLKRGPRKEEIKQAISKLFSIEKEVEDQIDIIWLCNNK